MGLWVEV